MSKRRRDSQQDQSPSFLPPPPSSLSSSLVSSRSHTAYTAGGTPVRSGSTLAVSTNPVLRRSNSSLRPYHAQALSLDCSSPQGSLTPESDRTPTKQQFNTSNHLGALARPRRNPFLTHSTSTPSLRFKRPIPSPSPRCHDDDNNSQDDVFTNSSPHSRSPMEQMQPSTSASSGSQTPSAAQDSTARRLTRRQSYQPSSPAPSGSSSRTQTPTTALTASRRLSTLGLRTSTPPSATKPPRRSDLHERDVDQIRSQSRAGFSRRDPNDDDASDLDSFSPSNNSKRNTISHSHAKYASDTGRLNATDDEDSGETFNAQQSRTQGRSTQQPKRRGDLRFPNQRPDGANSPELGSQRSSSSRAPIPSMFRPTSSLSSTAAQSSPRLNHKGKDASYDIVLQGPSQETVRPGDTNGLQWPSDEADAEDHHSRSPRLRSSTTRSRPRRYASDAQAADIPTFDYAGRAGTNAARLSVDSSAAARYLAASRTRTTSGPHSASVATRDRPPSRVTAQSAFVESPTDNHSHALRSRKLSALSSSSSNRPPSRLSSKGSSLARGDIFDDSMRPLPSPRSPRLPQEPLPIDAMDRIHALQSRRDALQNATSASAIKQSYGAAIDDLRARIEDVDIRGSNPSVTTTATTSSGAPSATGHSASRLRSLTNSKRFSLQHGEAPASEPRRGTIHYPEFEDRANLSASNLRSVSRLAGQRTPATPESSSLAGIPSSSSRPASRFSAVSRSQTPAGLGSGSSASMHRPMTQHERNTRVAFEIFERHFAGSNARDSSPTAGRLAAGPEATDLVDKTHRFLETVSSLSAGLREATQYVIQREIEVEVSGSGSTSELPVLKELDGMLATLMKQSDSQVRNLSDLLVAFTRADKERSRMGLSAPVTVAGGSDRDSSAAPSMQSGYTPSHRPDSRFSASGSRRQQPQQPQQYSPSRRSAGSNGNGAVQSDFRRSATLGHNARHSLERWQQQQDDLVSGGASFDAYRNGRPQLDRERSITNSSGGTLRREVRDIRGATMTSSSSRTSVTGAAPSSPGDLSYSPENSYQSHHGRSQSELSSPVRGSGTASATSPSALAAERRQSRRLTRGVVNGSMDGRGSTSDAVPLRARPSEPSSSNTIRARSSIMSVSSFAPSPRRPKMSDPSVDTAIAIAQLGQRDDEQQPGEGDDVVVSGEGGSSARRNTISTDSSTSSPGLNGHSSRYARESIESGDYESNEPVDEYSTTADASGITIASSTSTSTATATGSNTAYSNSNSEERGSMTPRTAKMALRSVSQTLGRSAGKRMSVGAGGGSVESVQSPPPLPLPEQQQQQKELTDWDEVD